MLHLLEEENTFFANFFNLKLKKHQAQQIEFSTGDDMQIFVNYKHTPEMKVLNIVAPLFIEVPMSQRIIIKMVLLEGWTMKKLRPYERIEIVNDQVVYSISFALREKFDKDDKRIYVTSLQQARLVSRTYNELLNSELKDLKQVLMN